MDLGIRGKKAIICVGNDGVALSAAEALAHAGVALTLQGPDTAVLSRTADHIRAIYGVCVEVVILDVHTADGRRLLLEAVPNVDILITSGDMPYGNMWFDWKEDMWRDTLQAEMLTPVLLISAILPGMIERGWGRIVNITAASHDSGLSASVFCGLAGFVSVAARQVSRHGIAINNLSSANLREPTTYVYARAPSPAGEKASARSVSGRPHFAHTHRLAAMAAFLCSQHCGSMIGQTVHMEIETT
ncbi:SDR family NAD(P)-dependent oxidoreductase [Agrobacterium fabrum]|uniref:SDR family NAD(P)-dependent oxidoreductase n=1 Tax=Agrobacterium fabrum TaxID=1176649 RepID=UPI003BA2086F